jgi:hypothetical protein
MADETKNVALNSVTLKTSTTIQQLTFGKLKKDLLNFALMADN